MKTIFTLFTTFLMVFNMYSQPFAGLVLEELDNGGAVTGTTYRLYAQMNEGLVYSMWAKFFQDYRTGAWRVPASSRLQGGQGIQNSSGASAGEFEEDLLCNLQ